MEFYLSKQSNSKLKFEFLKTKSELYFKVLEAYGFFTENLT